MKRIYRPYQTWECYKYGMWETPPSSEKDGLLHKAIQFTGNHALYGKSMMDVVFIWENSMLHFLTNLSINRKAYVGHCAVMYGLKIPESVTRSAWSFLSNKQQYLANLQAKNAIESWEKAHAKKLRITNRFGEIDAIQKEYQMKLQFQ